MKADDRVVKYLRSIVELVEIIGIEYLIFGSCGTQSYLPYFFRIPNDIDLVLREKNIKDFLCTCNERGFKVIEEIGRYKIYIDNFPIHVIPEIFSIVDKESSSVFSKVDLSSCFERASQNSFNFLYSDVILTAKVLPLDYSLLMELDRKQDTNSFYSIMALLSLPNFPMEQVVLLINEYARLKPRIKNSLAWLKQRLENNRMLLYLNDSSWIELLDNIRFILNAISSEEYEK